MNNKSHLPRSIDVCFLGVDGSGKSTTIDLFRRGLDAHMVPHEYVHLKPSILRVSHALNVHDKNPHAKPPRSNLTSFIKLTSWVLLYQIRRFSLLARKPKITIWDRYIYDLLVDQKRYRTKLPNHIIEILTSLSPKPDAVFVLDISAEEAFSRKNELTTNELHRLRLRYKALKQKVSNCHIIDSSRPAEDVAHEVATLVSKIAEFPINNLENSRAR